MRIKRKAFKRQSHLPHTTIKEIGLLLLEKIDLLLKKGDQNERRK